MHSSFANLRTPIDLFLCLHPPASLPLILQSTVPYCYFLSSRGFSFLPPACCRSPSCFRCPSRFTICYFPRGVSLRSLLLSFSASPPSCGSSWVFYPFGGPSTPSSSVLGWFSYGISLPIGFIKFRFGSSLFVFSACWVSLPCVLHMLLFLASLGYVPAFFCSPPL